MTWLSHGPAASVTVTGKFRWKKSVPGRAFFHPCLPMLRAGPGGTRFPKQIPRQVHVARRERALKVEVPKPEQDRPELGRVGVIAVAGFAIGVAWPWLAGVKLVPSPPNDEGPEVAAASSASAAASAGAPPAAAPPAAAEAPAVLAAAAPKRTDAETMKLSELQVSNCRDAKGKKLKECDRIGIDDRVRAQLGALASCEAASGSSETLSLGLDVDFEEKSIRDVFAGKSTTFSKEKAHALVDCAKKGLAGVSLDGLDHEHARYTVFYFVEFIPPGTVVAAAGAAPVEETAEASGLATIGWDVAVVRDAPDTGKIETRLRYGTRVVVTARRGKWYEIKYDAKGQKGWVHRNALGL